MKSSGLSTQAFIISDDIITAHVTGKLMEMFARLNIKAEIFTDIEQGRAWLLRNVDA